MLSFGLCFENISQVLAGLSGEPSSPSAGSKQPRVGSKKAMEIQILERFFSPEQRWGGPSLPVLPAAVALPLCSEQAAGGRRSIH